MEAVQKQNKVIRWLRKLGFWGFLFFLAKGIVWLLIGYFVVK
jgi:hypothetical protein